MNAMSTHKQSSIEIPEGNVLLIKDRKNHHLQEIGLASDRTRSSSDKDKKEYVDINLEDIFKDLRCPICLGIIQKTRTVKECMHRFCKECIEKSMRLGNNECPTCRTHCASRRSLRDDANYDALIALLYPNIDKCEEEIQGSISRPRQRQREVGDENIPELNRNNPLSRLADH